MQFSQVIGHSPVKANLIKATNDGRVSHAMLMTSDSGVGGLPMAVAYATYLMCENRGAEDSCGVCGSCLRMSMLQHPDCHFVFPVGNSKLAVSTGGGDQKPISDMFLALFRQLYTEMGGYFTQSELYKCLGMENSQGNISKSEASEILRKMSFKSYEGGYKIVIMWLPERMHEAAANALLKLIEEPAPKTLFLLVSESPMRVIATIRSRCQEVHLAGLTAQDIEQGLQNRYPQVLQDEARRLSVLSQGSWVAARGLVAPDDQDNEDANKFMALMRLCYNNKYIELFDWAATMAPIGREAQRRFCEESISLIRQCYMKNIGLDSISYTDPSVELFCSRFAPYVNHLSVEALVAEFELLLSQIRQNGNPKILFAHFALVVSKLIRKL